MQATGQMLQVTCCRSQVIFKALLYGGFSKTKTEYQRPKTEDLRPPKNLINKDLRPLSISKTKTYDLVCFNQHEYFLQPKIVC